ncbi:MAG: J domain-containing protein [Clostridiales bacterium]|nr:J domain-containing protein [Clostridiales bacterium]
MNPYQVLGIKEGASQEEIRRAYLALVKKYHPDKYADNPLRELAGEKLKEVNAAYEMLQGKATGGGQAYQSGTRTQSEYSGSYAAEFLQVRAYAAQGNLAAAQSVLAGIPLRNAEWHYLSGIVYFRMGWYSHAREHLTRAHKMEPQNAEYANAYQTILNNAQPYRGGNAAGGDDCSCCQICSAMLCMNCLCNCFRCR